MVNKWLCHLVSGFTHVNERIATIRIRLNFYNISLSCGHTSMEEKDDVVKDVFCAKLEKAKIDLRDFNAKFWWEGIIGPTVRQFSLYYKLIDFAAACNVVYVAPYFSISKSIIIHQDRFYCD